MTIEMSSLTEQMRDAVVPLGAHEEGRAVEAALVAMGENRDKVVVRGAELAIGKTPRRDERPVRTVRVLLGAPFENVVHEILVDPSGRWSPIASSPRATCRTSRVRSLRPAPSPNEMRKWRSSWRAARLASGRSRQCYPGAGQRVTGSSDFTFSMSPTRTHRNR